MAFLIDRQGAGVKRAEAFAVLYEDKQYDRKMQKQFNVIVNSLKVTLEENGAGEVFEIRSGEQRVNPTLLNSDLFRLLDGDAEAVNAYRGEYMSTYSWASLREPFIEKYANQ